MARCTRHCRCFVPGNNPIPAPGSTSTQCNVTTTPITVSGATTAAFVYQWTNDQEIDGTGDDTGHYVTQSPFTPLPPASLRAPGDTATNVTFVIATSDKCLASIVVNTATPGQGQLIATSDANPKNAKTLCSSTFKKPVTILIGNQVNLNSPAGANGGCTNPANPSSCPNPAATTTDYCAVQSSSFAWIICPAIDFTQQSPRA